MSTVALVLLCHCAARSGVTLAYADVVPNAYANGITFAACQCPAAPTTDLLADPTVCACQPGDDCEAWRVEVGDDLLIQCVSLPPFSPAAALCPITTSTTRSLRQKTR